MRFRKIWTWPHLLDGVAAVSWRVGYFTKHRTDLEGVK